MTVLDHKQATWDFLAVRPECRLLLDLPTPRNGDCTFWNGLYVLGWDANAHNEYEWQTLRGARQPALLESLHALERVNLRVHGRAAHLTWLD